MKYPLTHNAAAPPQIAASGSERGTSLPRYSGGEEAFRFMDAIPMPVVIANEDGGILYCNRACCESRGCSADGEAGRPFEALFVDTDRSGKIANLIAGLRSETEYRGLAEAEELSWRLPDGRCRTLLWSAATVQGMAGAAFVFSGVDAGGPEQLSQRLQETELRGRAVAAASSDCIVVVDDCGSIESVNPATERLFGYAAAELVGRRIDVFLHYRVESERSAWLDRVLYHPSLGRRGADNEFTARRRDGETFPCDLSVAVQPVAGRRLHILMMRNASERRRAEQEMARMRLDLKSIIDSMPSVLVGVDCNCAITAWNKEAQRATGVPARHALGRPFRDFFPDLDEHIGDVHDAVEEHRQVDMRRITLEHDDGVRYLEVMVYPLLARGTEGAVIRVDDVSTRVRLEQTMVQTEKMVSVGGLAAGMAHEINNPLGAIAQSAQNVMRRISADLPRNQMVANSLGVDLAEVRRYIEARGVPGFLDAVRDAVARASHIVNDMLSFSRSSGAQQVSSSLNEMVDTALRLATSDYDLKKRYKFRHVRLIRKFAPALPEMVCDTTGIEQVILNLVKNAAQAMTLAGTEDPTIILRTARAGDALRLSVEDNGPGMEEEVRRRVFEPFFTTKEVGVGTGLGLSVSYFIITEQHNGSLSVESSPTNGARFVLELPIGNRNRV